MSRVARDRDYARKTGCTCDEAEANKTRKRPPGAEKWGRPGRNTPTKSGKTRHQNTQLPSTSQTRETSNRQVPGGKNRASAGGGAHGAKRTGGAGVRGAMAILTRPRT